MENYYYKIKFFILDHILILLLLLYSLWLNKKIFIISCPYGRWGNRLMLFSYMLAWAKQHDAIVFNPSFEEYDKYFKNFNSNVVGIMPNNFFKQIIIPQKILKFVNDSFIRISYRKLKITNVYSFNLESENDHYQSKSFQNLLSSYKIIFFHGFLFGQRNFNLVKVLRKDLNSLFEFSDNIQIRAIEILNLIKKPKIVGVCMRQGDYKNHFGGKLFLNDYEYKILIDRVQRLFGGDYGVFVASEEMKENPIHHGAYFNYGDPAVNLCTLSKCDYLIGPASTFMTWASFINNVKTCYIDRDNFRTKELVFHETTF